MTTIALIGAPGSGKSTVGAMLAERLDLGFVDVDATIEARDGRMIREIFAEEGEPFFRALEREATLELLGAGGVVSLGGGAPMTPAIADALAADGIATVWLQVDARNATQRIGLDGGRPLLTGGPMRATLIKLLNQRTPVYAATAQHHIDTSGREPADVVEDIVARLEAAR